MNKKTVFSNPSLLANFAAEMWTVENFGSAPGTTYNDLFADMDEQDVLEEYNAWRRVALPAARALVDRKRPLTLEELEPVSAEKRFADLY